MASNLRSVSIDERYLSSLLPPEKELETLFDRLWPICRSLTGKGFRDSLSILKEIVPLEEFKVASGTKVLDWTVPQEWDIHDAWIESEDGRRIVDFKNSNLHIVSYSTPVDQWMTLDELEPHLHSLPHLPEAIPYLTSYYKPYWGFCLTHNQRKSLKPGRYRAVIRSTLQNGHLNYGQVILKGHGPQRRKEVLISTYLCHPSLANNELSGPLVTTYLYRALSQVPDRKFDYRFVFVPETLGAISFLHSHGKALKESCVAGMVINCCGSEHPFTYKKSKAVSKIDEIAESVLRSEKKPHEILEFFPYGSDERQYCSPGFDLPVGSLMRAMYGTYPEYHTSLDNKDFISFAAIKETVAMYLRILLSHEENRIFKGTVLHGEPQLSPRGLYPTLGSQKEIDDQLLWMMWLISYSDGKHDLCSIAKMADCSILDLALVARKLVERDLLVEIQ